MTTVAAPFLSCVVTGGSVCVSRKLRLVRRTDVCSSLLALLHIDMCVLNILRVLFSLIAIYLF